MSVSGMSQTVTGQLNNGVQTKRSIGLVRHNIARFPNDVMLQLTKNEYDT